MKYLRQRNYLRIIKYYLRKRNFKKPTKQTYFFNFWWARNLEISSVIIQKISSNTIEMIVAEVPRKDNREKG